MRRTEMLQGIRLMKFEDVYGKTHRGELSQSEVTEVLGMSERIFRRWRRKAPRVFTTAVWARSRGAGFRWTL